MPMSSREVIKLLEQNGWKLDRISGSHHVFVKEGHRPIPVPHPKPELGHLAKRILKQAGIR